MSAVVLAFRPRAPGKIEIWRDGDDWFVRTDEGWRQITPPVARTLCKIADTITEKGGK
jgi:hypothetical protein